MKRIKHHRIKKEKAESSSQQRVQEEHDLAYYIHDRVELMHQVFSLLKYKELKAMAPECVRNLAIGDLEELCTEELLGISSKRLLAILDGVEPPSDTESSSPSPPPELETISLDSISSDEELLSTSSKKKKHKHHRHGSKSSKSKKKDKADKSSKSKEIAAPTEENSELSKASRAGLTVLELLELQARARAIRAQLQQEQAHKRPSETTAADSSHHSSDNEVEIKEERPEVVEISSEDEKPDVEKLKKNIGEKQPSPQKSNNGPLPEEETRNSQKVTKHVNDLIITVPQTSTRKIRLNRNKVTVAAPASDVTTPTETNPVPSLVQESNKEITQIAKPAPEKLKDGKTKKKKKDKKKKAVERDGSDHDEITLQLSDTEKMDLLEDLDESRKNYDKVSSSSEDSESSSSDSDEGKINTSNDKSQKHIEIETQDKELKDNVEALENNSNNEPAPLNNVEELSNIVSSSIAEDTTQVTTDKVESSNENDNTKSEELTKQIEPEENHHETENDIVTKKPIDNTEHCSTEANENIVIQESPEQQIHDIEKRTSCNSSDNDDNLQNKTTEPTEPIPASFQSIQVTTSGNTTESVTIVEEADTSRPNSTPKMCENNDNVLEINTIEDIPILNENNTNNDKESVQKDSEKKDESPKEHNISDGEVSDRQSSEVEAIDVQPEIVCISDEESPKKNPEKKKKKKEKKSKKEKKAKKSKSDFREDTDQNFYKDAHLLKDSQDDNVITSRDNVTNSATCEEHPIDLESGDDVYEILELSDDSSCYEVEGTVLSKEPTTEEIEALSARIDEIEREEVVTDEQIKQHEEAMAQKITQNETDESNNDSVDNISWKDRYLDSKKVKKVLTTANILNALRKKNKELKKKIQDSKKEEEEKQAVIEEPAPVENVQLEEGSIEQYNTLQGSTKYVDPVKEPIDEKQDLAENKDEDKDPNKLVIATTNDETNVTREMKKDARQLLKMYKKLLKHNDMNRKKDPNKKKKKKDKKKDKPNTDSNVTTNINEVT